MKKIAQMNKSELIEVFQEWNLELPDPTTLTELRDGLQQAGVDDTSLKDWNKKEDVPMPEVGNFEDEVEKHKGEDVVVKMTRENVHYNFGGYIFTQKAPFVVMKPDAANLLLNSDIEGFHRATKEEIKGFYK
jgi:hypothetical protein